MRVQRVRGGRAGAEKRWTTTQPGLSRSGRSAEPPRHLAVAASLDTMERLDSGVSPVADWVVEAIHQPPVGPGVEEKESSRVRAYHLGGP